MIYINSFNKIVSGQKCTFIKGPVSGMRQFLAIESPLKAIKNAFYFMLKALFVLKIFKFLPWSFDHVGKWLDTKAKVSFKVYNVTRCEINNYDTHNAQHLKK